MAVNVDRYSISSSTLIGQIMPFFIHGKRIMHFMAAICSPLDRVNKAFKDWAAKTLVDAATTSQVIVLKWSLKNKLSDYITDENSTFVFFTEGRSNYTTLCEDQHEQSNLTSIKQIYMPESVDDNSLGDDVDKVVLRNREEISDESNVITIVAPQHNSKVTDDEYIQKVKQCVEPYLAYGVDYKIVISSNK